MKTLINLSRAIESIPVSTTWYLTDLAEALGKQKLFTHQSPQKLQTLREHAIIESAVSSNRIEGVEVNKTRVGTVVFGNSLLKDRNEEEIRGYRHALDLIHGTAKNLEITENTIFRLHKLSHGDFWDSGKYKEKQCDIIEKYPDGTERIRFSTVSPSETAGYICKLLGLWSDCLIEKWVPPLVALAAFNLDFLCIHPFRDGNGRVSRLLLLLQSYHLGYEVGRYISLERVIEENNERYYETLEQSSSGWHDGDHDPWPFINYILFILNVACKEFEARVSNVKTGKGQKTDTIKMVINKKNAPFSISQLNEECYGVSVEMIRTVLKQLKKEGFVECLGRGQKARWQKTVRWELGNT